MRIEKKALGLGTFLPLLLVAGCTTFSRPLSEVEATPMKVGDLPRVHLEVHGMTRNA